MPNLLEKLKIISSSLENWKAEFPNLIQEIQNLPGEFVKQLERTRLKDRLLTIGVMGRVKAGKSTFLNTLLFNGLPILPEAATPKTANLTCIAYGEKPLLELNYYSEKDWRTFEKYAESADQGDVANMARELIKMAKVSGLDPYEKIQFEKESFTFEKPKDLLRKLNDYVGENGKYTPVVNWIDIFLPDEKLKDLKIVDTPGMNDPIVSRTLKTKEYMSHCDVVYFLSVCSQFVNSVDMELLSEQLPQKGVQKMVLLGCQMDNALLQDGYDREDLEKTEKNIKSRLTKRFGTELEKAAVNYEERDRKDIASFLREIKEPVFTSTFSENFISIPKSEWSEAMIHIYGELQEMAKENWNGYIFTHEDWKRIANFEIIRDVYTKLRGEKEELFERHKNGMESNIKRNLKDKLDALSNQVTDRIEILETKDMRSIEEDQTHFEEKIAAMSTVLEDTISKHLDVIHSAHSEILDRIQNDIKRFSGVPTRSRTRTHTEYETISTSTWWKFWTWGDEKVIERHRTESYECVLASDAVEKVINYGREAVSHLNRKFSDIFNSEKLNNELKNKLIDEMRGVNSDLKNFRSVIDQTISNIQIPPLHIDLGSAEGLIIRQFQEEILSDNKESLLYAQNTALLATFNNLQNSFEPAVSNLCSQLENVKNTLKEKLLKNFKKELEKLKIAFQNKEKEIASYKNLLEVIKQSQIGKM